MCIYIYIYIYTIYLTYARYSAKFPLTRKDDIRRRLEADLRRSSSSLLIKTLVKIENLTRDSSAARDEQQFSQIYNRTCLVNQARLISI